jgi:hypothetical protein
MHESIINTGKPENRAHYQAVCDALNSETAHGQNYGWHLIDLEGHMLGHTWKMVYRSDKRLTQPTINGMLNMMHGASIAVKHLANRPQFTKDELQRIDDCLEADEQEILDANLEFTYVYDQPDGGRRNATEEDRAKWLEDSVRARSKVLGVLK